MDARIRQILAMCIFGTIGLFVRLIPLPSAVIALSRGVIGAAFLLLVAWIRHTRLSLPSIRRNLPILLVSGAFLGANWILLFEAYRYTTVATATLCYYLAPVFVTLASPFVLHERLTLPKVVCVLLALVGMAFVSGAPQAGTSGGSPITGVLFGVGAAALYACIVLLNKKLIAISALETTVTQLALSALVLLPYVLLSERAAMTVVEPRIGLLLLVGVVHTGIAYALYFGSIRELPAQTIAILSYIDPIVAILLSALLLKERMGLLGVIGAILVLGSTLASELYGMRKSRTATDIK